MSHHFLGEDAERKLEQMGVPIPVELEASKPSLWERVRRWFTEPSTIEQFVQSTIPTDQYPELREAMRPARPGINPKDALGMAKPDLSVVPPAAELHLASAMMDGARKYGAFNWRENAVLSRVYVAAARRHLLQFLDGEDFDPTSGVHHLGHAMACCAIVLDAYETGNLDDNRPLPGAAGNMIRRWDGDTKFQ